jgi:hypothetical protein
METWIIDLGNGRWVRVEAPDVRAALIKAQERELTGTLRGQISNPSGDNFAPPQYQTAFFDAFNNRPSDALRIIDSQGGAVVDNSGNVVRPGTGTTNQPTPSGGANTGGSGVRTEIRGGAEAEFGPQFRAGLADRGITLGSGGGLEGRLAEQARSPFFSRALAQTAFADPSATQESFAPSFQEMVRTGDLFGTGATQQARDLLRQAQGFGTGFGNSIAGDILNPQTVSQGNDLASIAREAGKQRFGSFARFLPQAPELSEAFFSQPKTSALTFADFLNQRIFS